MKKLVEEVETEGLEKFFGKNITVYCDTYIYTGKLIGVNSNFILLTNAKVVYETGDYKTKEWQDAQSLPHDWYVMINKIESFGELK